MRNGKQGKSKGLAYLMLLVAVAVIGVAASSAISLGSTIARRDAELHLLAIGMEFQQALRSYAGVPATATAPSIARGPRDLNDLLKDPRSPGVRRHLRQLYADPLTGKPDWGITKDQAGFITGVYSLAEGEPIKRQGFDLPNTSFTDAQKYQQWVFGLPPRSEP